MDILKYKYWIVIFAVLIAVLVPIRSGKAVPTKIIIDHDGGADDAMAIFMALLYEKYFDGPTVIALTTTHGNTNEGQVFNNTQRILDLVGRRDVPIYRGSSNALVTSVPTTDFFGADGLGDNEHEAIQPIPARAQHAALAIVELADKYPGEIKLVAIGSLTNVALAIRLDPGVVGKLSQLYVGAGNVYSETEKAAEFNAEQDAEAYHIIAKNAKPGKVTILPFSEVGTQNVTRYWRERVLGVIPTKIMAAQNSFERISIQYHNHTWSLLDPIVVGVVLNDTIVRETKYSQNDIILCGEKRGINTNNFTKMEEANVKLINGIIEEEYQNLLLSIFSAELKK